MSNPSLHDLRTQARVTFSYWHIYLMYRLREIETHLTQAERDELGQIITPKPMNSMTSTLIEYGLLTDEKSLPDISPPVPLALPDGNLGFYVLDASFYAVTDKQQLELMRVDVSHVDVVQEACAIFNAMLRELAPDVVLECARWWAVLQGARVLNWQTSDASAPKQKNITPNLPRRNRGRGAFRGF